jgi:hypothetical protein
MALLNHAALLALVGACYAPDVRDCAVTCSAAVSCAAGEVCGADGFCAAPSAAGHCGHADAGTITVHVTIGGRGRVLVDSTKSCDSEIDNGDCTFAVPVRVAATIAAMVTSADHPFMAWTGTACTGTAPQCMVTPTSAFAVGAVFK